MSRGKAIKASHWVFVAGILLTALITVLVMHLEDASAEAEFERRAEQELILLDTRIQRSMDQLFAVGSFFDANANLSREQFKALSGRILDRQSALQALEWIPKIKSRDISGLERDARREGFANFFIREQTPDKTWIPVQNREDYYPVWFVEPYEGNEKAFGFDLGSNPARRAAIEKSMSTGLPVATARITLVQETSKQFGFLLLRPVFENMGEEGPALKGFALAVYRIGRMVESQLNAEAISRRAIEITIFDQQGKPGETRLYPVDSALAKPEDVRGFSVRRDIQVADRIWTAVVSPPGQVLSVDRRSSIIVAAAGLLFSLLAAIFYAHQSSRGRAVEALVSIRTRELEASQVQLKKATDEAVHANRMKSVFLASMGHEFRTPMNAIMGLLHVLDRSTEEPTQKEYFDKMRASANRLLRLIDDILDISRIEAGKLVIESQEFRLENVLNDVLLNVAPRFRDKAVELVFSIEAGMPANLKGDSSRITQILINLIDNAAKFTQKGRVELLLSGVLLSEDRLLMHGEVIDTGMGIGEEDQARLFKPFVQAESTHERQMGGTGLGLAICRQLLQLMGGTIQVSSTLGVGSRFVFELPLGVVNKEPFVTPDAACSTCHIVLIEHDEGQREASATLLRALGVRVDALEDLSDEALLPPEGRIVLSANHPRKKMIEALINATGRRIQWMTSIAESHYAAELQKPLLPKPVLAYLQRVLTAAPASALQGGPRAQESEPLSPEALKKLGQLAELLERGDLEARALAREILGLVEGSSFEPIVRAVDHYCDNFDFKKALTALADIVSGGEA